MSSRSICSVAACGFRRRPTSATRARASCTTENTIAGIERITAAGAFPTICVFRPTTGSDMEDWPVPEYEDMRGVMLAMYKACRRHRVPVGMAPNVEVSLVVTPDDAALLAPRRTDFFRYELWRRTLRAAAQPVFASRLRARPRPVVIAWSPECPLSWNRVRSADADWRLYGRP